MGCNCKKKYKAFSKIADNVYGGTRNIKNKMSFGGVMKSLALGINQFILGIIASAAFIVLVIPLLLYVIFCILFGKEPSVRIPNLKRRLQPRRVA